MPLIASGGAGALDHFPEAVAAGADAVLAASVFHFGQLRIDAVKRELALAGYPVREALTHGGPMTAIDTSEADPALGLRFNDAGLVCAVVQQYDTKEVLMVAWMDAEALRRTVGPARHVLLPFAAGVLGQGRDVRQYPAGCRGSPGLRRGHPAGAGRSDRRRLPYRNQNVFRRRPHSVNNTVNKPHYLGSFAGADHAPSLILCYLGDQERPAHRK